MRNVPVVLCLLLAAAGCDKKTQSNAAPAPGGLPPLSGAPASPATPAAAAPGEGAISGTVLEKLDAAGYSYLRLKTGSGEIWAAVPPATSKVGDAVTVQKPMPMDGFESKTLNRKFEKIVFGTLAGAAPAAAAPSAAPPVHGAEPAEAAPSDKAADHMAVKDAPKDVKVDKATGPGAVTIAEAFAKKAALKEQPVAVRGKVVKFSAGIMGKNWLHIRDGSGDPSKDGDLTVTTKDTVAVGDVVVVKGKLSLDRDFGAGYAYPVIVEDAAVTK